MYRSGLYRYFVCTESDCTDIDIQCTETGCTEKTCTESVCTEIVMYRKRRTPTGTSTRIRIHCLTENYRTDNKNTPKSESSATTAATVNRAEMSYSATCQQLSVVVGNYTNPTQTIHT